MAFGAQELRVLRRALALALRPSPASPDDVQDCLRLAESVDEAAREGARQRAFLLADLARYRGALPGTATGYYRLLEEALTAGHLPGPDDLAALRALSGNAMAAALLARCREALGETAPAAFQWPEGSPDTVPVRLPVPALIEGRVRLLALPGGRAADEDEDGQEDPSQQPSPEEERPGSPQDPGQKPGRPIPTPGEVFPPRRKPGAPPPSGPARQCLAAV
jgi:hypothetical protein